jgi:hypothetical protein
MIIIKFENAHAVRTNKRCSRNGVWRAQAPAVLWKFKRNNASAEHHNTLCVHVTHSHTGCNKLYEVIVFIVTRVPNLSIDFQPFRVKFLQLYARQTNPIVRYTFDASYLIVFPSAFYYLSIKPSANPEATRVLIIIYNFIVCHKKKCRKIIYLFIFSLR